MSSLSLSINLHRLDICSPKPLNPLEEDSPEIVVEMMTKIREFHSSGSFQLTTKLLLSERQDEQLAFNFMDI